MTRSRFRRARRMDAIAVALLMTHISILGAAVLMIVR